MKKEYDIKKLRRRPGKPKVDKDAAKIPISIRLDGGILADLKAKAEKKGIPYQTYIGSILHQYMRGEFVEKDTVELLKKAKRSGG